MIPQSGNVVGIYGASCRALDAGVTVYSDYDPGIRFFNLVFHRPGFTMHSYLTGSL